MKIICGYKDGGAEKLPKRKEFLFRGKKTPC